MSLRLSRLELRQIIERLLARQLAELDPRVVEYALNPFAPKIPFLKLVMEIVGIEDTEFAKFILDLAKDVGHSVLVPRLGELAQLAIKTARERNEPIPFLDEELLEGEEDES